MTQPIKIEGLSKHYGTFEALHKLNLEVNEGEVLGYLGPNGAGKTTTIRLLLGLIKPSAGRSQIFGLDCQTDKIAIHKRVGYVTAEAVLWPSLTGAETLHLLGKVHGQVDEQYKNELIKRFDFDTSKKFRAYSKGNRQKLSLIAGLMTRSELLILDEPTAGLDPLMEQAFHKSIYEAKQNNQTVFLSSHILSEVEALCDRVAILRTGKLVEVGTLDQIRHLSAVTVEAICPKEVDFSKIPGVAKFERTGQQITCQVQGTMAPLIKALAVANATKILSREPSLEELFLSIYGEEEIKQSNHNGQ